MKILILDNNNEEILRVKAEPFVDDLLEQIICIMRLAGYSYLTYERAIVILEDLRKEE